MRQPTVYLGPYAEWLLRPKQYEPVFLLDPFWGHDPFWPSIDGKLTAAWSGGLPPEVTLRGRSYRRFPFLPNEFPPVRVLRELRKSRSGLFGAVDLRDLDVRGIQAEINWLARVYARELASLGEHIGRPATLHWGIIAWKPD